MRSYRPEELFDEPGGPRRRSPRWRRAGERRMSANPHANGGLLAARPATCPTSATTPSTSPRPGEPVGEATRQLGQWLRDVVARQPRRRSG